MCVACSLARAEVRRASSHSGDEDAGGVEVVGAAEGDSFVIVANAEAKMQWVL